MSVSHILLPLVPIPRFPLLFLEGAGFWVKCCLERINETKLNLWRLFNTNICKRRLFTCSFNNVSYWTSIKHHYELLLVSFVHKEKYSHICLYKTLSTWEPKHKMGRDGWTMQWFSKCVPRIPMTFQGPTGQDCFDNNTKRLFTFVNFIVPCVYDDISQRLHDLWYCNQLIRLSAEADMRIHLSTLEPSGYMN